MKKNGLKITRWVLFITVAFLLGWDIYAQLGLGTSATISNAVIVFAHQQPWVIFLVGFVLGHLLWRMEPTKEIVAISKKWGKPTEEDIK